MKILLGACGFLALGLGLIGVFLPLLPTVPFFLLAAVCFSRSSDRLHTWLIEHDIFGPSIQRWRESGAISLRAKWMATISIGLVFSVSLLTGVRTGFLIAHAIVLGLVLAFIWSRPKG